MLPQSLYHLILKKIQHLNLEISGGEERERRNEKRKKIGFGQVCSVSLVLLFWLYIYLALLEVDVCVTDNVILLYLFCLGNFSSTVYGPTNLLYSFVLINDFLHLRAVLLIQDYQIKIPIEDIPPHTVMSTVFTP